MTDQNETAENNGDRDSENDKTGQHTTGICLWGNMGAGINSIQRGRRCEYCIESCLNLMGKSGEQERYFTICVITKTKMSKSD